MESKEALERLLMLARPCDYEVRKHRNNYCDMLENIIKKDLDQLEEYRKIEEEFGIDLITLFKVLKYGVYYYTSQNQLTHDYVWLYDNYVSASVRDKLSYSLLTCFQKQILSFEDYGKTWSIDRKELEECLF